MRKIIASVDIGSDTIKIIVGELRKNRFNLLAVSDTPSKGVKKGIIVNEEDVTNSLKNGFKRINELLGVEVNKVVVSIPENDVEFMVETGSTTITNPDKVITGNDIVRALQASIYNKISDTRELITLLPVEYIINEEKKVKNPKGIIADKLSVKAVVTTAPKDIVYKTLNILEKLNIEVIDVCFGSIGDYYELKTEETDSSVGIIVNLGDETTKISVFNKGLLTNTKVLDVGGNNIDNDISFIYKVNKIDSKFLKEKLALAHKRLALANEYEEVTNKLGEVVKVNQYELTEIVMSRLEEIINLVKKEINHLTKKEISYIIFTGGLSEINDFKLILDEMFKSDVILAQAKELGLRHNKYSTGIGMIKFFNSKLDLRDKEYTIFSKDELEELSSSGKRVNISSNSIVGKIFGYFFDN